MHQRLHRIFVLLTRGLLACGLLAPLVASATPFKAYWPAEAVAALPGERINLKDRDGNLSGTLPASAVRLLIEVRNRLTAAAGLTAELHLVAGDALHVFAATLGARNVIGLTLPMLKQFGDDADALATFMAHELAHLMRAHGASAAERDTVLTIAAFLDAMGKDRPLARRVQLPDSGPGLAALNAAGVPRSFGADEERETDDTGLRLMRSAGFDPARGVRLWRAGGRGTPYFAAHPSSAERIAAMQTVIASITPWQIPAGAPAPAPAAATPSSDLQYEDRPPPADDRFLQAMHAYRSGRSAEARLWLQESAAAGDPRGQLAAGAFLLRGQAGFERDYAKAADSLLLADKQGSAMAATLLGTMHEQGLAMPRDAVKAAEFYQRAAIAEFPDAMARLALLKMRGQGPARDLPGAFELAARANAGHSTLGGFVLGLLYYTGTGVQKDLDRARMLFETSAARGYSQADVQLAGMHASGTGVAKNFEIAALYYHRAVERNDASAKANLGFLYLGGMGVKGDPQIARRLFEEAHKQRNALGALGLGHIYRDGLAVQADEILALALYEVAVRRGLASATQARDALAARMSAQDLAAARSRADAMLAGQ